MRRNFLAFEKLTKDFQNKLTHKLYPLETFCSYLIYDITLNNRKSFIEPEDKAHFHRLKSSEISGRPSYARSRSFLVLFIVTCSIQTPSNRE